MITEIAIILKRGAEMSWGVIATWQMAHDGVVTASEMLKDGAAAGDAVERLIQTVEDCPDYQSVGYGGLPNEEGVLEMDAAFMDGNTFKIGGVAGIQDVQNPISVARQLSDEQFNSFRVGAGATKYATLAGFTKRNMLTDKAHRDWAARVKAVAADNLNPYDGHDTVGAVTLDATGRMTVGTSTSGLFMKKLGRVGDSPLSGSGFYVDSEIGGASATGLGEDLMKGCLSYEIVRLMATGLSPQAACDQAVYDFADKLGQRYGKCGAMSLIAMNRAGEWGVATNVTFTFSVANDQQAEQVYVANPGPEQRTVITPMNEH